MSNSTSETQAARLTRSQAQDLPDAWLAEDPLPRDPIPILKQWLDEAFAAGLQANPHAVSLATVDPDGRPSARMVLCNQIDVARGGFVMYTNRESRKGRALAAHPYAAIVFHWGPHNRSARVEGRVEFTADEDCDAYFATRPVDAQIGAWASEQSEAIGSRAELVEKIEFQAKRFGVTLDDRGDSQIPRPPHWGGFTLVADAVELWVSRPARIHDRALWQRSSPNRDESTSWDASRLQP
jgi:pyridoxamine 5'-phosphate oxidase